MKASRQLSFESIPGSQVEFAATFREATRQHLLMITNHGIHEWKVDSGLQDTGGQNGFVNEMTSALVDLGFRVTVCNRGGYPHPRDGSMRRGIHYRDAFSRLVYVEDGIDLFVRKEDMFGHVDRLAQNLSETLRPEGFDLELIVSHYWDSAEIGRRLQHYAPQKIPHVWIPHSLGRIKRRNLAVAGEVDVDLNLDRRIRLERALVSQVHSVFATSSLIRESLRSDYGYDGDFFFPPGVDTTRFHPRRRRECQELFEYLSLYSPFDPEELRRHRIVSEVSRTDRTKRKDILIKAFAILCRKRKDTLLVMIIDNRQAALATELKRLISALSLEERVIVIRPQTERIPYLYSVSDLYCSPSVMEGFGMAAQEAAASGVPVVGSDRIPFLSEYLLGESGGENRELAPETGFILGDGGIIVKAGDVSGFASAMEFLLSHEEERRRMAEEAWRISAASSSWIGSTRSVLSSVGLAAP